MKKIGKNSKLVALLCDNQIENERVEIFNSLIGDNDMIYMPLYIKPDVFNFTVLNLRKSQISLVNICKKYFKEIFNLVDEKSEISYKSGLIDSIKISNNKLFGFSTFGKAILNIILNNNLKKIAIFGATNEQLKDILYNLNDLTKIAIFENDIEKLREIVQDFPEIEIYRIKSDLNLLSFDKLINLGINLTLKDSEKIKLLSQNEIFIEQSKINITNI